jgi:hypothetical protein
LITGEVCNGRGYKNSIGISWPERGKKREEALLKLPRPKQLF